MSESTTYLAVPKAMEYIDSPSPNAFRKWVKRHGVPHFRYGRELRFLRRDLDLALSQQRVLKPRPSQSQHSKRSLHHAGVSQQAIRDVHTRQSDESADAALRNSIVERA